MLGGQGAPITSSQYNTAYGTWGGSPLPAATGGTLGDGTEGLLPDVNGI